MKKSFILLAAFAAAASVSCKRNDAPESFTTPASDGSKCITVKMSGHDFPATRATVAGQGKEDTVATADLMLFDSEDNLYRFHTLTSAEIAAKTFTFGNVKAGSYTVAAVANGPDLSSVTTLAGLKAETLLLSDYNATASGFAMWGEAEDVSVTSGDTTAAAVELKRLVGRVSVSKITNGLPSASGSLTIDNILLTNVNALVNADGSAVSTGEIWYNMEGRSDASSPLDSTHIINGSTYVSQCADLTFKSVDSTLATGKSYGTVNYFYGYANASAVTPSGFVATYPSGGQQTCLVVTATFGGEKWYYPVVLDDVSMNTTCDVQLTIKGKGSDDPNKPVTQGAVKVTITVADWTQGTSYVKVI